MGVIQSSVDSSFHYTNFKSLKRWLIATITDESFSCGDVSIIFTSDLYLLELNKKHLQHDYFTDVLTFDYSTEKTVSGDIFVSIDRVSENADLFDVEFLKELDRVIIHGVLHLIGYEDSDDTKRSLMRAREDYYLEKRNSFR